jgi:hypothetical protein
MVQPSLRDQSFNGNPNNHKYEKDSIVHSGVAGVVIPGLGLRFSRKLSFEKWFKIGQQLSRAASSSAWCLGDWLIYGEEAFVGRYRDAIERTSLDYQTLRNYAWVARSFPLSRRRDTLSFGHHAEVAALAEPEQNFWLRKAEELSWSRNRLRRELRGSLRARAQDDRADVTDGSANVSELDASPAAERTGNASGTFRLEISVSAAQLERFSSQARDAGLSLEAWALSALNQAAEASCLTVLKRLTEQIRQRRLQRRLVPHPQIPQP